MALQPLLTPLQQEKQLALAWMLALLLDLLPPPPRHFLLYLDLQLDLLHMNLLDPGICIGICTCDQNWIFLKAR